MKLRLFLFLSILFFAPLSVYSESAIEVMRGKFDNPNQKVYFNVKAEAGIPGLNSTRGKAPSRTMIKEGQSKTYVTSGYLKTVNITAPGVGVFSTYGERFVVSQYGCLVIGGNTYHELYGHPWITAKSWEKKVIVLTNQYALKDEKFIQLVTKELGITADAIYDMEDWGIIGLRPDPNYQAPIAKIIFKYKFIFKLYS